MNRLPKVKDGLALSSPHFGQGAAKVRMSFSKIRHQTNRRAKSTDSLVEGFRTSRIGTAEIVVNRRKIRLECNRGLEPGDRGNIDPHLHPCVGHSETRLKR